MKAFRLPLEPKSQRFSIVLGGVPLAMLCRWNAASSVWEISLFLGSTGEALFQSMNLVTGVDLLSQHRHLGIPGSLIATTNGDQWSPPTFENLGSEGNLFYMVTG